VDGKTDGVITHTDTQTRRLTKNIKEETKKRTPVSGKSGPSKGSPNGNRKTASYQFGYQHHHHRLLRIDAAHTKAYIQDTIVHWSV